jgi:hypothetical protein
VGFTDIEVTYGSIYFIKFSIILMIAQKFSFIFIVSLSEYFLSRFIPHISPILQCSGCGGILYAWMVFQSITITTNSVDLLGMIPVNPSFAPLMLFILMQIIHPRMVNVFDYASGVICGLLLGIGLLNIIPNLYWTICFFFNLTICILYSIVSYNVDSNVHPNSNANSDTSRASNDIGDIESQLHVEGSRNNMEMRISTIDIVG